MNRLKENIGNINDNIIKELIKKELDIKQKEHDIINKSKENELLDLKKEINNLKHENSEKNNNLINDLKLKIDSNEERITKVRDEYQEKINKLQIDNNSDKLNNQSIINNLKSKIDELNILLNMGETDNNIKLNTLETNLKNQIDNKISNLNHIYNLESIYQKSY